MAHNYHRLAGWTQSWNLPSKWHEIFQTWEDSSPRKADHPKHWRYSSYLCRHLL